MAFNKTVPVVDLVLSYLFLSFFTPCVTTQRNTQPYIFYLSWYLFEFPICVNYIDKWSLPALCYLSLFLSFLFVTKMFFSALTYTNARTVKRLLKLALTEWHRVLYFRGFLFLLCAKPKYLLVYNSAYSWQYNPHTADLSPSVCLQIFFNEVL